jgi:hypothetical protein
MMTDEQKTKVAELKAAIAASVPTAGGAPRAVRAAVLALKKELRRSGTTARVLAAALGVHETTLCRWERAPEARRATKAPAKSGRGGGFRMVQLTGPERTPGRGTVETAVVSTPRGLRVAHAPSGLVVDGLDVETLAALLRRMS